MGTTRGPTPIVVKEENEEVGQRRGRAKPLKVKDEVKEEEVVGRQRGGEIDLVKEED